MALPVAQGAANTLLARVNCPQEFQVTPSVSTFSLFPDSELPCVWVTWMEPVNEGSGMCHRTSAELDFGLNQVTSKSNTLQQF